MSKSKHTLGPWRTGDMTKTTTDVWKALEIVINDLTAVPVPSQGSLEHEFVYDTLTEGLPKFFACIAYYDKTDESFDAHGDFGELQTQHREDILFHNVEVWHKGILVDPEDFEPGLERLIEEEALELIQDL